MGVELKWPCATQVQESFDTTPGIITAKQFQRIDCLGSVYHFWMREIGRADMHSMRSEHQTLKSGGSARGEGGGGARQRLPFSFTDRQAQYKHLPRLDFGSHARLMPSLGSAEVMLIMLMKRI